MSKIHPNTCPAFFTDATLDPAGSYSPCTALGGGAYRFPGSTFKQIWDSDVLEDARQRSLAGEKLDICRRCWTEEEYGHKSERQYQIEKAGSTDYVSEYQVGPKNLNIKVGNICNLRCRTCQSYDSYLYLLEGEHYEKKNNISGTPYTKEKFKKHFTYKQLDELYEYTDNIEKIELYGGEPFLDEMVPSMLLRMISNGQAKNIDLKVSTNCTHKPNRAWSEIINGFKNTTINMSVDAIGDRFTYMRFPGDWEQVDKNIKRFIAYEHREPGRVKLIPVICVSAMNVWNFDDVYNYFKKFQITPFTILVQWPYYYCVNVLPDTVKQKVKTRLQSMTDIPVDAIINLMETEPRIYDPQTFSSPWDEFNFWLKEKDIYRQQNFKDTFPEYSKILYE